ncbi:MAG: hypothetical protein AAGE59_13385 [Cyanobacteria bacterium P01_F01_bin.86]
MVSFRYYKKHFSILLCVGCLLAVLTSAAFAQGAVDTPGDLRGARGILESAIEISKNSEQGLDELWNMTFTGSYSPAYIATMDFARKVMVIPFFWLLIPISKAFIFNRYEEMFKQVAWLVLVMMLVANNFALTSKISYGARGFINDSTRGILEQQLGPITMQEALQDAVLTEAARDIIRTKLAECEAKEAQLQYDCYQNGAERAKEEIDKLDGPNFAGLNKALSGVRNLGNRLNEIIEATKNPLETPLNPLDSPLGILHNFLYQSAGQALAQQLMKGFQNAMVTLMDVGFFLTAMLGPVAVAATLAPLTPRIIMIWGTAMLSFGMMKMSYNILIGAIASVALVANAGEFGSIGLLMAMAVVSPVLAMAMSAWGGTRIVQAMVGAATTTISMIPVPIPGR